MSSSTKQNIILGIDFIRDQKAHLDFSDNPPVMSLQGGMVEISLCGEGNGKSQAVYTVKGQSKRSIMAVWQTVSML